MTTPAPLRRTTPTRPPRLRRMGLIGRCGKAARVEGAFEQAWQRADVWITGSRF